MKYLFLLNDPASAATRYRVRRPGRRRPTATCSLERTLRPIVATARFSSAGPAWTPAGWPGPRARAGAPWASSPSVPPRPTRSSPS